MMVSTWSAGQLRRVIITTLGQCRPWPPCSRSCLSGGSGPTFCVLWPARRKSCSAWASHAQHLYITRRSCFDQLKPGRGGGLSAGQPYYWLCCDLRNTLVNLVSSKPDLRWAGQWGASAAKCKNAFYLLRYRQNSIILHALPYLWITPVWCML